MLTALMLIYFGLFMVLIMKDGYVYNKRYKKMVDFLWRENDNETLKAIGYKEFYGEEYGLRKTISFLDATLQLYKRYNETQKTEYVEYAEFLERARKRIILIFVSFIVFGIGVAVISEMV